MFFCFFFINFDKTFIMINLYKLKIITFFFYFLLLLNPVLLAHEDINLSQSQTNIELKKEDNKSKKTVKSQIIYLDENGVVTKKVLAVPKNNVNPVLREQISNDDTNPKPIGFNNSQTEPPVGKKYLEKWIINSARSSEVSIIDPFYLLSPKSYIIFEDSWNVHFKLNENFPEQIGKYSQSENQIRLIFENNNCSNCLKEINIGCK